MTCEEFRQQLFIDPYCGAAVFHEHSRACPACALAAQEALRFEESIRTALASELSSAKELGSRGPSPVPSKVLFALLFLSLLMTALWLAMRGGFDADWESDPAAIVIGHIQAEEERLQTEGIVPWVRVRRIFGAMGADADPRLGPVRYAGRCVIGERYGIHLVVPGERGAVTVLFMPENGLAEKREVVGGGLEGTLLPAGSGSLAVVGEPGELLDPIARRLLMMVRWNESGQPPRIGVPRGPRP
jgi:hypothetical protein